MDLKEVSRVDPKTHWYYQAKLFALQLALRRHSSGPRKFIDVGAGSGFFAVQLADFESGAEVVCVDTNYPSDSTERGGALRFVRKTAQADTAAADIYLFIDVLEHVADDVNLLRSYTDSAAPGALVLITVPAFMSMWSGHDTYLEHYRRYRLGELRRKVGQAGLEVVDEKYLFGAIFPLAWLLRRARRGRAATSDMAPLPPVVNKLLTTVLTCEHRLKGNRVAGLTAFVVARVPSYRQSDE